MIIFRYIVRELLSVTVAVTTILLLVLISGRFVKYLAEATQGQLDPFSIFAIIGYRIPGFLELTLPLAFFLALLLTLGRLYVENEMSVLQACGITHGQILRMVLVVAIAVAGSVGWLSLTVSPAGIVKAHELVDSQRNRGELDKLPAKRFYTFKDGRGVAHINQVTADGQLQEVFFSQTENRNGEIVPVVVVAESAHQQITDEGTRYLVLENGYRIEGLPGKKDYQVVKFAEFGTKLAKSESVEKESDINAIATADLLESDDPKHIALLQWRLSIPLLVLVVSFMAVSMSKTQPRQGRFGKLLPAILFYFVYLISLNAARGKVESGDLDPSIGIWAVHGLFFAIALIMWLWTFRAPRSSGKRVAVSEVAA